MTSPRFLEPPPSIPATPVAELDKQLARLADKKDAWAKLPIPQRIAYLEDAAKNLQREAEGWVKAINAMKGIAPDESVAGEDWLAGPMTTARNIRLLIDALKQGGHPAPPSLSQRPDGQW